MKRHPNFKTGRVLATSGYYLVFVGKHHHLADVRGYAYEHRINAEKKIGRRLKPGEQVHHIDEDKTNNDESNLEVVKSFRAHKFLHRKKDTGKKLPEEKNITIVCACGCGTEFKKYDSVNRPRKYVSGHNPPESPTRKLIQSILNDGSKSVNEIIKKSKKSKATINTCISKMAKAGLVIRIRHGYYGIPE